MFTLCRIALLSARKPSRIAGLLFTYKNDDFGAVSVTKLICAAPISKVERHISDRFCARLWCSVNRKRSRSRSDDYREIKIHVYAKRQREFVPREQVFPLFSVYSLLLLRKNKQSYASFILLNRSEQCLSAYLLF